MITEKKATPFFSKLFQVAWQTNREPSGNIPRRLGVI
jgi:hypothetical protein